MNTTPSLPKRMPASFDALMRLHALRPIADDVDLANATEVMDRLAIINAPTPDQADYLHTLSLLIEAYEAEHHPIGPNGLSGVDALAYLMAANNMSRADLGRLLGVVPSAASMIVAGRRAITAEHARKLGEWFAVRPGAFIA